MVKVFIDGSAGTTGLRIAERLASREDIALIKLPEDKRKDATARKEAIVAADVAFLCLPDAAAVEAAKENNDVEDVQEAAQLRALVQRSLSGRDRQIIVLRYGFGGQPPMTQQQVAQLLGISRSYVSRLESRTLAQLREMLYR